MSIRSLVLNMKFPFFLEILKNPGVWIAVFLSFLMAILESAGVFALSVLLTSFAENFDASLWDILPYGTSLSAYVSTISTVSLQGFLCLFLILRYLLVITFHHIQFSIIYNVRLLMSKNVLKSYSKSASVGKNDNLSQSEFMRNYINGIDHIADNGLMASMFLIKELATTSMLIYLLITQLDLRLFYLLPFLGFFLILGYILSQWIKGLGLKIADISLLIYSKANDFSRMANYFSYSNRSSNFQEDLNQTRSQQIRTLKRYGALQTTLQPMIELCFVFFLLFYIIFLQGIETSIGDISLILVALARLIPAGSRVSSGLNSLNYCIPYLKKIFKDHADFNLENTVSINNGGGISVFFPQFKYREKIVLRKKVTVSLGLGEIVKLAGASGSGKTSLLNLLASSSSQTGVDVGYVEQFPTFFEGTVYENLTLKNDTIDKNEVLRLGKFLLLGESFGCNCEEVFDIWLSDNGNNLSGGQKKKLALIREKLKRPQLLLLDELNAGLDKNSVNNVYRFLIEQFFDIPIIYTAHTEGERIGSGRMLILSDGHLEETL